MAPAIRAAPFNTRACVPMRPAIASLISINVRLFAGLAVVARFAIEGQGRRLASREEREAGILGILSGHHVELVTASRANHPSA